MNFLAHLYLSGDDEGLIIGNFIADAVKGAKYKEYSEGIARGILLHRAIDDYTDKHPVFMKSVTRIRQEHGKFAGVIADIFYDHFLARNWNDFSAEPLSEYVEKIHRITLSNKDIMPERSQYFLKYMIQYNWLLSYANIKGIESVLQGMSKRTKFANSMDKSIPLLEKYYADFESEFRIFFGDVRIFVGEEIKKLSDQR